MKCSTSAPSSSITRRPCGSRRLPFGGNKGSGNGREGIHDTLHEMSKEKTLLLHEVFGAAV